MLRYKMNVSTEEQAIKVVNAVQGKTYLSLKASYGVMHGNYPVTVWTEDSATTQVEFLEMVIAVMAEEL